MKLYAYIEPSRFKSYLAEKNIVESEETRSSFLRDVGTPGIVFNTVRVGYVEVSPGSCVRLYTKPPSVPTTYLQRLRSLKWGWCW